MITAKEDDLHLEELRDDKRQFELSLTWVSGKLNDKYSNLHAV